MTITAVRHNHNIDTTGGEIHLDRLKATNKCFKHQRGKPSLYNCYVLPPVSVIHPCHFGKSLIRFVVKE